MPNLPDIRGFLAPSLLLATLVVSQISQHLEGSARQFAGEIASTSVTALGPSAIGRADLAVHPGAEPTPCYARHPRAGSSSASGKGLRYDWLHTGIDLARSSAGILYGGPFTSPQLYRHGPGEGVVRLTWRAPSAIVSTSHADGD